VLIPACNEAPEVLERTLRALAHLDHPALQVLLVENSRDPVQKSACLAGARRLGVDALDLVNRGSKAAALNDARAQLHPDTRYVLLLDADQALREDLLRDALPLLEDDPGLAFVQTAQAYEDCTGSLLAAAAAQQQMLVYDCVLESKNRVGQVYCLGTNVVLRLSVLDEVGVASLLGDVAGLVRFLQAREIDLNQRLRQLAAQCPGVDAAAINARATGRSAGGAGRGLDAARADPTRAPVGDFR
jgi:cellulose synthase/poly-beta-1,6-N-acetylglucosamine synthase-like glycosyltransferase